MSRVQLALLVLGFSALVVATPQAGDGKAAPEPSSSARLTEGKRQFAKWCAPCHANRPNLAGTAALQVKYGGNPPAALELRTDLTPELVEYFVRNGVAWMAPFRKTEISDAQLASIGAYLSAPIDKRGDPVELLADEMMRKKGASR